MDKEDYDLHIELMIDNLIHDKTCFNIRERERFYNIRDTHSYLEEEVLEAKEAIENVIYEYEKVLKLIRDDKDVVHIMERMKILKHVTKELVAEGLDICAVIGKAELQLIKEKAPAGGNPN